MNRALLEQAAKEFLIEGYEWPEVEKVLRSTADPAARQEAREKLLSPRTVPDGCFYFLQHIIWLDGMLEIAPHLPLFAEEAEGLLILRRARNWFQRTHPPCPYCGMPNEEHALQCRECLKEIAR